MSSSYRSQTVRNPYTKSNSASSQNLSTESCTTNSQPSSNNNDDHRQFSNDSNSDSTNKASNKSKLHHYELINALREYCNHVSVGSNSQQQNDHDLNTSFSISSHAKRQRKLLRNITFELKQITQFSSNNNSGVSNDDEYSHFYESFYLKGVGCDCNFRNQYDPVLLPWNNDSTSTQLVDYLLRVMKSINRLLLEEYYEKIGTNYRESNNDNYKYDNNYNDFDNNETLVAALDFINVAYTCLEPNIIFASLQAMINCEEFKCVDLMMKRQDQDVNDDDNEQEYSCEWRTVLDALIYFALDPSRNRTMDINHHESDKDCTPREEVENVDNSFLPPPSSNSKTNWKPSRIQVLSFSALTKALLNAEFVQRYCTSLYVLPEESIDTLLGDDMGLGLIEKYNENMTKLVIMAMQYLSSIPTPSRHEDRYLNDPLSPMYQKNDNHLFTLACMSFLSCLYRTNASEWMLVPIPNRTTRTMILKLQNFVLNADETSSNDFNRSNEEYLRAQTSSLLAQALLLIIEWKSPGETRSDRNKSICDDENVARLLENVFSTQSLGRIEYPYSYGGSIYLLIHLCIVRHERLKRSLQKPQIIALMKESIVYISMKNNEHRKRHGQLMVILHFIIAYPHFRRSLDEIFEKSERVSPKQTNLRSFLGTLLDLNIEHSFSSVIGHLAFLRSLLPNNDTFMVDNLSSKTGTELLNVPSIAFVNKLLEPLGNRQTIGMEIICFICAIGDFIQLGNIFKSNQADMANIDLIVQVFTSALSSRRAKNTDFNRGICVTFYGMQLGIAMALGQISKFANLSSILRLLKQFAANTIKIDNVNGSHNSKFGVIDFAVNQAYSRDLTRRAVRFQSMLSLLGSDMDNLSQSMFAVARKRVSVQIQLSEQSSRYQEQLQQMNVKYEVISKEKENIENELANRNVFFEHEIQRVKIYARADAIDQAEILKEEKFELEQNLSTMNDELNKALSEKTMLKEESVQREGELNNRIDENLDKIRYLEGQIKMSHEEISRKEEEISSKAERIFTAESSLHDVQSELNDEKRHKTRLIQSCNDLKNDNDSIKERLEDALSKLISLAKIYTHLEKKSETSQRILEEKISITKKHENEVSVKYQRLKGMYRDAEEKIKDLSHKLQKVKSSKSASSQSSKQNVEFDTSTTRRRQPMGTLAFMNSIHDTSMRSEKRDQHNKDNSNAGNNDMATKRSLKKKSSSFRIVR